MRALHPTISHLLPRAISFSFFSSSFSSPPLLLSPFYYYILRIRTLKSTPPKTLTSPTTTTKAAVEEESIVATMERGGGDSYRDPSANPKVARLRELVSGGGDVTTDGWEKCWDEGLTPWDLGRPTPVVPQLAQSGTLPKGRVLVPGCGTGYDVAAFANPERFVVGLDISETAIRKAKEWSSSLPNANFFTFMAEDFFTWQPTELFDLIFDYTLLISKKDRLTIQPSLSKYISALNGVFGSYEEVLSPMGFKALSIEDNEFAIGPRKGREKVGRWKRYTKLSSL